MKKLSAIIICLISILSLPFTVFAENELQDGVYEVNITLLHAEEEKTSMGNNYIAETALLEVENGTKTLIMVQSKSVSNLQFWYYLDGSCEGNSAEVEVRSNVSIGGKSYEKGYAFPLVNNGDTFGVKFKASIMPMTPSARVKVDFVSAKLISSKETTTEVTTTQVTTTTPTTVQTTVTESLPTTVTEMVQSEIQTTAPVMQTTVTEVTVIADVPSVETAEEKLTIEEILILILLSTGMFGAIIWAATCKSEEK